MEIGCYGVCVGWGELEGKEFGGDEGGIRDVIIAPCMVGDVE